MKKYLVFDCLGICRIHPYQFDFSLKNNFFFNESKNMTSRIPGMNSAIPQKLSMLLVMVLFSTLAAFSQSNGTAPMTPPSGGFSIEGDLTVNTQAICLGDWVDDTDGGRNYTAAGFLFNTFQAFCPIDVCNENDLAREHSDNDNDIIIARGSVDGSTNNITEINKTLVPSDIDPGTDERFSFASGSKYFRCYLLPIPILPLFS
jgi:hypothetical protein